MGAKHTASFFQAKEVNPMRCNLCPRQCGALRTETAGVVAPALVLHELRRCSGDHTAALPRNAREGALITVDSFVGRGAHWCYWSTDAAAQLPMAAVLCWLGDFLAGTERRTLQSCPEAVQLAAQWQADLASPFACPVDRMPQPMAPAAPAAPAASPAAALAAGEVVKAPMPGVVLKVQVQQGQAVKAGQVLIILEAMKMENEINSHKTGRVGMIAVKTGDAVNTGDVLLTVE